MAMRTITVLIRDGVMLPSDTFAGYALDNLSNALEITVPSDWPSDYTYRLKFRTSQQARNKAYESTTLSPQDGKISFSLPSGVMVEGPLDVQLRAYSGDTVVHTAVMTMTVGRSLYPDDPPMPEFSGLVDGLVADAQEAIDAAEAATAAANAAAGSVNDAKEAANAAAQNANTAADAANTAAGAANSAASAANSAATAANTAKADADIAASGANTAAGNAADAATAAEEAADAANSAAEGIATALDGKVDKEAGKGLSTNDYTTAEKTKLAGLERATTEEAKAGTDTMKLMTPATTKAAIAANFYSLTADAENIPSSTSIGAVTTPGFYTGSGDTSGPEGGQFLLIVETHGTYARQTIDYSGEQYVRWGQGDGSYWLSWEKLTNDGALYVAGAGINSGWDYRRWSDGKIEFWSSAYITGGAEQIEYDMAYPFTLTGAPIVWTQGVDNCWDLARPIYVEPSVNKNIKIYLYPRSTDSRTYRVNVYAVGNMA